MYQHLLMLWVLFPVLVACSKHTVDPIKDTSQTPITQLSTEQENQRRKLAQSFTVAGMHLGMGYVQAKAAVTDYLATIDEQYKPFLLKEANYVDRQAAFYDQRYAALTFHFHAYYGKYNQILSNGVNRTYDKVRIHADFVPAMVWNDEQPLYLYRLTQSICPHTEEELNRIISATLEKYGPPDDIMETGPKNRIQRFLDPVGRGINRHYIWRLNNTGPTKFNGNQGYIKNGIPFYDDVVFTLTHSDIRNWQEATCDAYRSKLHLSITDELYNAYADAGFPASEETLRLIEAKKVPSEN